MVIDDAEMNDILPSCSREKRQNSVNVNEVNQNQSKFLVGENSYISLKFLTHVEAYRYYNLYAFQCGFGTRKVDKQYLV